jgi:hypothetical protein
VAELGDELSVKGGNLRAGFAEWKLMLCIGAARYEPQGS